MKPRGFAALSPEARAAISSKGGKSAHAQGRAHTFSSEEARVAGAKGGKAAHANRPEGVKTGITEESAS